MEVDHCPILLYFGPWRIVSHCLMLVYNTQIGRNSNTLYAQILVLQGMSQSVSVVALLLYSPGYSLRSQMVL